MKMFDGDNDESLEALKKQVSQFEAMAKNHQILSEEVAMLVNMKDQFIPEVVAKVKELVGQVEGGFNLEKLEKQALEVLNRVISQSDYTKLRTNVENSAKKLTDSIEVSSKQVEKWRDDYHQRSRWHYALISGAICLCIGFASAFIWLKPSQVQQQNVLNEGVKNTGIIAEYVQNKCKNLK